MDHDSPRSSLKRLPWFARQAFLLTFGICPPGTLYFIAWSLIPAETMRAKPSFTLLILFIGAFITGMIALSLALCPVWALCMRLVYGAPTVRSWLSYELPDVPGKGIEELFRKACFLVL